MEDDVADKGDDSLDNRQQGNADSVGLDHYVDFFHGLPLVDILHRDYRGEIGFHAPASAKQEEQQDYGHHQVDKESSDAVDYGLRYGRNLAPQDAQDLLRYEVYSEFFLDDVEGLDGGGYDGIEVEVGQFEPVNHEPAYQRQGNDYEQHHGADDDCGCQRGSFQFFGETEGGLSEKYVERERREGSAQVGSGLPEEYDSENDNQGYQTVFPYPFLGAVVRHN